MSYSPRAHRVQSLIWPSTLMLHQWFACAYHHHSHILVVQFYLLREQQVLLTHVLYTNGWEAIDSQSSIPPLPPYINFHLSICDCPLPTEHTWRRVRRSCGLFDDILCVCLCDVPYMLMEGERPTICSSSGIQSWWCQLWDTAAI